MSGTLTFTAIVENPEQFTSTTTLRNGEIAQFRPLRADDRTQLGNYFEGLSEKTRSRYGPHGFTMAVAAELCNQIGRDDSVRMIGVIGQDEAAKIIAYFILDFAIPPTEHERYLGHGIVLHNNVDCRLAPSVADRYQNRGVGSALMPKCKEVVRWFGYQRMILMGGVLVRNPRAVHFYQKHGFRKVGDFQEGTDNASYDMILSLT
ncbi:GNAT family N-acetyltransferase [Chloroflexi bacterium TSY]|nr:GNAT family N-acetyltransferase [Chloroflexi bacterium TSY]